MCLALQRETLMLGRLQQIKLLRSKLRTRGSILTVIPIKNISMLKVKLDQGHQMKQTSNHKFSQIKIAKMLTSLMLTQVSRTKRLRSSAWMPNLYSSHIHTAIVLISTWLISWRKNLRRGTLLINWPLGGKPIRMGHSICMQSLYEKRKRILWMLDSLTSCMSWSNTMAITLPWKVD